MSAETLPDKSLSRFRMMRFCFHSYVSLKTLSTHVCLPPIQFYHRQYRFEKLDITPKSAQKIKPVLEQWMKEAKGR